MEENRKLLENLGIELRGVRNTAKVKCPKCSHTRKKKNEPCLNVNVQEGTYKCWNPGCDFKGSVVQKTYQPPQREYVRPKFNNQTNLSENLVKYMLGRSISQKTLSESKITEGSVFMPQVYGYYISEFINQGHPDEVAKEMAKPKANVNTIQFNYFRKGELVNVKYRDGSKNFRMEKNAELIFYGYDDVVDSEWCVIVEGEVDKLSWNEAGVKEVISVPNGAVKSDNPQDLDLEYLDNCYELFSNKKRVILATDNDEAGMCLRDELARRIGVDRCFKIDFGIHKDSNDFLKFEGPEKLKALIDDRSLIEYPVEGIFTASMFDDDIDNYIQNGLPAGEKIGIPELDERFTWLLGYFIVVTGIPNHGKSPFTLQVACKLSVDFGWKWGLFTPEHRKIGAYYVKIIQMITGKRPTLLSKEELRIAKAFVNDHFFIIKPEDYTTDGVLEKAKTLVLKKGIRGLIADPFNKFEHNRPSGLSETEYVSKELDKFTDFCEMYNVLTMLVAHPTKMKKDKSGLLHEVPTLYDISSSSNFYNKPDGGITVYRNHSTKKNCIYIQKVKDDHIGSLGVAELEWNPVNGRLSSQGKHDNTNWLEPKIEQGTMNFERVTTGDQAIKDFQPSDDAEEGDLPF